MKKKSTDKSAAAAKKAKEIIAAVPELKGLLELNLDFIKKAADATDEIDVPAVKSAAVASALKSGNCALDRAEIEIDPVAAAAIFLDLVEIARKHAPIKKEAAAIARAIEEKKLDVRQFIESTLEDRGGNVIGETAERIGVEAEALGFIASWALKPLLAAAAQAVMKNPEIKNWSRPFCPMCGSSPYISDIRGKEGERFLHCPTCAAEWKYYRVRCPFCGNEDQKTLAFLYHSDYGASRRADTCAKCRRYLKAVERKESADEFIPEIEDIATLHLDVLARKKGFSPAE